jgi:hypothetical protein
VLLVTCLDNDGPDRQFTTFRSCTLAMFTINDDKILIDDDWRGWRGQITIMYNGFEIESNPGCSTNLILDISNSTTLMFNNPSITPNSVVVATTIPYRYFTRFASGKCRC